MKKFILIGLSIVVILAGGALAVNHYNEYQTKEALASQVAAEELAARVETEKNEQVAKVERLTTHIETLRIECEKGKASYVELSAYTTPSAPDPQCGTSIVQ